MKSLHYTFVLLGLLVVGMINAQPLPVLDTSVKAFVEKKDYGLIEVQGLQTGDYIPYWMRSLQHGSVPVAGTSLSVIGAYVRDYRGAADKVRLGMGLQVRGNLGTSVNGALLEAYVKAKTKRMEFKAGRFRQVLGLTDSTLGIGGFTYSGNSLPIPMIQARLPENSFPLWDSLISFHGTFAQGWMGDTRANYSGNKKTLKQYMHQKSLYIRIGKPTAKVSGTIGIVHQAFWVNHTKLMGDSIFKINPYQSYMYLLTGKQYAYKQGYQLTTNLGNHVGQLDLGIDIVGKSTITRLYRQFLFDTDYSYKKKTLKDGLNGISIVNRKPATGSFYFRKLTVEYFSSMNETSNIEYYNHEMLYEGVSYLGASIGNPFLPLKKEIRSSLPTASQILIVTGVGFPNTRVRVLHTGMEWAIDKVIFRNRFSFSRNFGMLETKGKFPPTNQFSMSVEAGIPLRKGWQARTLFALDSGGLYYNSAGGFISMMRIF